MQVLAGGVSDFGCKSIDDVGRLGDQLFTVVRTMDACHDNSICANASCFLGCARLCCVVLCCVVLSCVVLCVRFEKPRR